MYGMTKEAAWNPQTLAWSRWQSAVFVFEVCFFCRYISILISEAIIVAYNIGLLQECALFSC